MSPDPWEPEPGERLVADFHVRLYVRDRGDGRRFQPHRWVLRGARTGTMLVERGTVWAWTLIRALKRSREAMKGCPPIEEIPRGEG